MCIYLDFQENFLEFEGSFVAYVQFQYVSNIGGGLLHVRLYIHEIIRLTASLILFGIKRKNKK